MARLSEYNYEMCVEICSEVAEGFNIKTVLKSKSEYPTFQTWCNWKREHKELIDLYTRSIQDKAESVDEEIDLIMSEVRAGEIEPSAGRILIDTLKWKASKYYPKMFGDKTILAGDPENPLNTSVSILNIDPLSDDADNDSSS